MEKVTATFPVIIDGVSKLKDRSVKITCVTREFSPEESAILFSLGGLEAYAMFSTAPLDESDIPDEPLKTQKKSRRQKVRERLYRLWEKKGARGEFSDYYDNYYDRCIAKLEELLDE